MRPLFRHCEAPAATKQSSPANLSMPSDRTGLPRSLRSLAMTILLAGALPALAQEPAPATLEPATPPVKLEDGNSYFHTDLFAQMNDSERGYYNQTFVNVMTSGSEGKPYKWEIGRLKGEMTLRDTFTNASKMPCHRFSEWYQLGNIRQTYRGIACMKEEKSWCKLRPNSTPTCNLSKPGGIDGLIIDSQVKMQKFKSWWPF